MSYVILGAGPAGVIAAETLRKLDPGNAITLIGEETEAPYSRMALPYLLAGDVKETGTHLRHAKSYYEKLNVDVRHGKARQIDVGARTVELTDGTTVPYSKLLVATGSHTVRPPIPGMDLPGIENCWTLADARAIALRAKPGSRVVLMGAGFIGCIVLEALAARKVDLTVIEMADRMLPRMMDDVGGMLIKSWCESKGVTVLTDTAVEGITESGKSLDLELAGGNRVTADLVVCATGVRPNVDFLDGTGVVVDDGILVDNRLCTSIPNVFAAGDVAQGLDRSTGTRKVHAIQPTASEHGRIAARNMAGHDTPYGGSLSMNVLNTLGLVSSSFGLWDGIEGGESSVAVDSLNYRYLRLEFDDDYLVGALALGLTQHVGVIRGLMQTQVPLGEWKQRLLRDPHQIMHAYLDCTQGVVS